MLDRADRTTPRETPPPGRRWLRRGGWLRRALRLLGRTTLGLIVAAAVYLGLLIHPDPLFAHASAGGAITLHSDEPIPPGAREVIRLAEAKVRRSPLFDPSRPHHVYACQSAWRWRFFANISANAGGIAYAPIGRAVFLRRSALARNRMIGPSGNEVTDGRTLDYYVAHEVTHTLTADFVGARAYYRLPVWVREGYADYIGRGEALDYEQARAALLSGERTLDPALSGHYLRYVLLVAHVLEREGRSVASLLRAPPDAAAVEARVRAEPPAR